jgi:hypothetical protein
MTDPRRAAVSLQAIEYATLNSFLILLYAMLHGHQAAERNGHTAGVLLHHPGVG